MYKATGEQAYLDKANSFFDEFQLYQAATGGGCISPDKTLGAHVMLYHVSGGDDRYRPLVEESVNFYLNEATYTPGGLLYLHEWASIMKSLSVMQALQQVRLS